MDNQKSEQIFEINNKQKKQIDRLRQENKILRRALNLMAIRLADEVDHFDNGIYGGISRGPRPKEWVKKFIDWAKEGCDLVIKFKKNGEF